MNALARWLAVYLVLVLVDAAMGFGLYRKSVHALTGAYCRLTRRNEWDRARCTERIVTSRLLWLLISAIMGLCAGYVTLQLLTTRTL